MTDRDEMSETTDTFEDALKILSAFEGQSGELFWRTSGEFAPVTFMVNCNDLFYWGCADAEPIVAADIPDLEAAKDDMRKVYREEKKTNMTVYGELLWCARKRRQRPQKAYYKYFPETSHALFDACGPEDEQYGTKAFNDKHKLNAGSDT